MLSSKVFTSKYKLTPRHLVRGPPSRHQLDGLILTTVSRWKPSYSGTEHMLASSALTLWVSWLEGHVEKIWTALSLSLVWRGVTLEIFSS